MQRDDQKCYVSKISKTMVITNQGINSEQCIRNNDDLLALSDVDK